MGCQVSNKIEAQQQQTKADHGGDLGVVWCYCHECASKYHRAGGQDVKEMLHWSELGYSQRLHSSSVVLQCVFAPMGSGSIQAFTTNMLQ